MSEEKPIVYILRGDDREAIETHLRAFRSGLGSPEMAEMNLTRLEGQTMTLNDLRGAALAMPFLTERRLVIVEDALKPFLGRDKGKEREQFTALLDTLPQSTALVLVIPDTQNYRGVWGTLSEGHWLIKWTDKAGNRSYVVDCALPTEREMAQWIRQKTVALGGSITPQAANTLSEFVGNDTQQATQEMTKLLTFVNFERPVDDDDVRQLITQDYQKDIFSLVDAIGSRDGKTALEMFHLLLEENHFLQIFSMIIRQFRLILMAKEILDLGGDQGDVMKKLHLHKFVAGKITNQTRLFSLPALESLYLQLLEIDLAAKTSQMPGDVALDLLITRLSYQ